MQPSIFPLLPSFAGPDIQPADDTRLRSQFQKVIALMRDGRWRTLAEIRDVVGGSEAGVSARLRDARKPAFGGYTVERQRLTQGLWEYRLCETNQTTRSRCASRS